MRRPEIAPYGAWRSPITAESIVQQVVGLAQVTLDGDAVYWLETRPQEGGRGVVVRWTRQEGARDLTPPGFNVRSRVHEYGGGAFTVADGTVYCCEFADQRLYRQAAGATPQSITPDIAPRGAWRYADLCVDHGRGLLYCVREDHSAGGEPVHALVCLDPASGEGLRVIVAGNDFYASPRLSPDGMRLAWLAWNHPDMPWDGTELWVGELDARGSVMRARRVAGGREESIFQPQWSPQGVLHFVSDRSGWWNLYRWREEGVECLAAKDAEFGVPQWVLGLSTYAFAAPADIVCAYTQQGRWQLARLSPGAGALEPVDTPYTDIADLCAGRGFAVFCGASAVEAPAIVRLDLATGATEVLRRARQGTIDAGYLSAPQPLSFATGEGAQAHALYYPPCNQDFAAPADERPPLIVKSHGGPSSAASSALDLRTQYWTSRGFAVLDVNYRGSTGYGRAYTQSLYGRWGLADVDDCVNGARRLAAAGVVDGRRLIIRGGSAGGYTTLCALTFRDTFRAGASYYGISDLEALARDTHKFESRYLDKLVGPYPERRDLYRERSPIHFVERLACPVIFFQGLQDKVVPPSQAERMVEALRAKGLMVSYVAFADEQHGFRHAQNIMRALEEELGFYAAVFGIVLPEPVGPGAM